MKRVLTAVIAVPIVLLITIFSPDWVFAFAVGLVSTLAVDEFLSLAEKKAIGRPGRWFLAAPALVSISFIGGGNWVVTVFALSAIALLTVTIFSEPIETALGRVAAGLSGIAYCSLSLGFLVLLPRELVLALFAIIWVGDTAAYYGGRAFGSHPLAPKVSPKKTLEGAVAGLIGSVAAGLAAAFFLGEPQVRFAGICAATAIAGQLGDLAESVLKRSAGVK